MSEEEKKAIRNLENLSEFGLSATLNQADLDKMKIVLNLIEKQQKEIENIKKEVQEHIAFENRLKRDNTEPDLFNQGRFYVANNIKDILDGKEII